MKKDNNSPEIKHEAKPCSHEKTFVAVRHASGMKLVKCSDCRCTIYFG